MKQKKIAGLVADAAHIFGRAVRCHGSRKFSGHFPTTHRSPSVFRPRDLLKESDAPSFSHLFAAGPDLSERSQSAKINCDAHRQVGASDLFLGLFNKSLWPFQRLWLDKWRQQKNVQLMWKIVLEIQSETKGCDHIALVTPLLCAIFISIYYSRPANRFNKTRPVFYSSTATIQLYLCHHSWPHPFGGDNGSEKIDFCHCFKRSVWIYSIA